MAEPGDHITFSASFAQLDGRLQEAIATVDQKLAEVVARGDEAMAQVLRVELEQLQKWAARAPAGVSAAEATPQIEKATAAIDRENQARQLGLQIERAKLEVIKFETQALAEQETVSRSLVVASRRGGTYEQLAGQQGEAERVAQQAERAAQLRAAAQERLAPADVPILTPPQGIVPVSVPQRRGGAYEELAGVRAEAEERHRAMAIEQEQLRLDERRARQQEITNWRAEAGERLRAMAIEQEQLRLDQERVRQQQLVNEWLAKGQAVAASYAKKGQVVPAAQREELIAGPKGADFWTPAEERVQRVGIATREYDTFAARASISTEALTANMTRLGMVEAEASNELRRHGALTTEWLAALGRGETTVSELGYQIGATMGKFAGWAVAAAATYGVASAFGEMVKGATDSSNAVGQLKRTIDGLDTGRAAADIRQLSENTAVPIKEAGDAIFAFSRTFHDLPGATAAAKQGLSVLRLDNVQLSDSVKLSTAIHQQWGYTVSRLASVYDMVAAGQREYNARISDMVPLLQKSSGAVKNAGGDLTQLIQIATVALRLTQQSGANVGTALYRAAATQVPKNAASLVSQFGLGRDVNPLTGEGNVTQLIMDAIRESATMSAPRRQQLSNLIFGQQYGGRSSALFGPESAALLAQVTTGPQAITPQATRGSLQQELATQLAQTRKEMEQFTYGLQRLGSALASTGALQPLGLGLRAAVGGLDVLRQAVDVFNQLPGPLKTALDYFLEIRLAMLAITRTRIGASIPGATALAGIPGFGRITETRMRGELATGTRAGLQHVEQDIQRTTTDLLANASTQTQLEQRRLNLIQAAGGEENLQADALEQSNLMRARIIALSTESVELEARLQVQLAEEARLRGDIVGITAINRNKRYSREQIEAMSAASSGSAAASLSAAEGLGLSDAAMARVSAAKGALAGAMTTDAAATAELSGTTRTLAALGNREAMATVAAAEATDAAAVATKETAGIVARVGEGIMGFAAALDPLTIGLVALPFALDLLNSGGSHASAATQRVNDLLGQSPTTLAGLEAQTAQLGKLLQGQARARQEQAKTQQQAQGRQRRWEIATEGAQQPPRVRAYVPVGRQGTAADQQMLDQQRRFEIATEGGRPPRLVAPSAERRPDPRPVRPQKLTDTALLQSRKQLDTQFEQELARYKQDAETLVQSASGRKKLDQEQQGLQSQFTRAASHTFAGRPTQYQAYMSAFYNALDKEATDALETNMKLDPSRRSFAQAYAKLAGVPPAKSEQYIGALSNASQVFGTRSNDLTTAITTYAVLVDQFRNLHTDPQSMQRLSQDMTQVQGAISKHVQDYLHMASIATTNTGQQADITAAMTFLQGEKSKIQAAFAQAIAYARKTGQGIAAIKSIQDAEAQFLSGFADVQKSAVDAQLQLMQSQEGVATSQIKGISPESDLARQQTTLQGIGQRLHYAKTHGADAQTVNGLVQQYNDAQNSLQKSQTDNARSIVDAQGQLAESQITGTSSQADIERARVALDKANQILAFDKAHGAGTAQLLTDQAAVYDAVRSLNEAAIGADQQIAQNAAALIDARAQLQEAQTLDPVKAAKEQLAADIKILATIKPGDYKTHTEFLTAHVQQQAKVAGDRRTVTQDYVDTQMQTLQFELHVQQISDQQYVAGLQRLLKLKKLSQQQRQSILTSIYDVEHQTAVNLNVGDIRLPTSYEVRRSIAAAARRGRTRIPQNTGTVINHHVSNRVNVNVTVHKDADVKKVFKAFDDALNSNVAGQAQARGVI